MTQREKLTILLGKMKAHNFFEDGPYMISRREAEAIQKAMAYQLKNLERNHAKYEANIEEERRRSRERYYKNRDSVNEQRKRKRFQDAMEAIK